MCLFFALGQSRQGSIGFRHMLRVVPTEISHAIDIVGKKYLPMRSMPFVALMACRWLRMKYLQKFIACTPLEQLRAWNSSHMYTHIIIYLCSHHLGLSLIGVFVDET